MSSKSGSSSRHSSPRAMPVETIITRFKSAQQKRQLREMDRSMSKVTELLKNPLKPRIKKKVSLKKVSKSSNLLSIKDDGEEQKRTRRNKTKVTKTDDTVEEHCPSNLKRHIVLNKIRLKPKHDLKIIAQTNKRKRSVPLKGSFSQDYTETVDRESRDESPNAKKSRPLIHDMTMGEMIQLIEDSGSLNDEDLLEILTCPSPVWWEDPPDGYIEDALFTRPRSSAEMYPSIRSQLQENLQDRKRSNTPNVLSRRERGHTKRVLNSVEIKKKERGESISNNNDIDLEISLSKRDEKFIKKRTKLESVLGNLKNKTFKSKEPVKITKPVEESNIDLNCDNVSNKVSVIINLCSDQKADVKHHKDPSNLKENTDRDKQASIAVDTDSDCTDDDRLTDISLPDDALLNDLENMDIPMQQKEDASSKEESNFPEGKTIQSTNLFRDVAQDKVAINFKGKNDIQNAGTDSNTLNNYSFHKSKEINFKERRIDPTYSDRESSIIEDYFEMKLFEEDDVIVNKKRNEYSKSEPNNFETKPLKCKDECKQHEKNLTTSVIKFKNPDNTSINIFKIESVVPINLPPLKNSDKRKGNTGCIPENLPPLKRNPVIQLNSESPKSNKSSTSFDTSESYSSVIVNDNIDSISDTNICFMNEDEDDSCIEKRGDNNNELESTSTNSSHVIKKNVLGTHDLNQTPNNGFSSNFKYPENKRKSTNDLHFSQDVDLYKNFTRINSVINNEYNDLEFQSLTITKVNEYNCCKMEDSKRGVKTTKKKDINRIRCDEIRKELSTKSVDSTGIQSKPCVQNEFNKKVHDEFGHVENESDQCITIYKIVSDDSGNDEPKSDHSRSPEVKTKDLQDRMASNELDSDSTGKMDSNKDKMVFYFKKCKNLYWKHKNIDRSEDKKGVVKENDLVATKKEITGTEDNKKERVGDIGCVQISGTRSSEDSRGNISSQNNKEANSKIKPNSNVSNSDGKEQKCIIVSNTKQIRYCMKCSSIFDTAQCNYCYKNNGTGNKNQCAIDYVLKMEKCFVCDVCRYKALSKDSLERHISNHCCDSKKR